MYDLINYLWETGLNLLFSPEIFEPLVFPGFIAAFSLLIVVIWLERKIAAIVQMRYGPYYISRHTEGALQLVADLLRFLFSEVIIPKSVDKIAYILAPIILFAFTFLPIVVIPVSRNFAAINHEYSLLIALALMTLYSSFLLIVSWASNNKFSFIGGLREGFLSLSYEIPLIISALSAAVFFNSFNLIEIVEKQVAMGWGILYNPLAAMIFLVVIIYSTSRYPYEIAEAESEIVIGPFTEYTGILFGLGMGISYIKLYSMSLLYAVLFLGGWEPVIWPLNLHPVLPGIILFIKTFIIVAFSVFLRAVYPRYRIDQALRIAWWKLFLLAFLSLLLSYGIKIIGVMR